MGQPFTEGAGGFVICEAEVDRDGGASRPLQLFL